MGYRILLKFGIFWKFWIFGNLMFYEGLRFYGVLQSEGAKDVFYKEIFIIGVDLHFQWENQQKF